MAIGIRNQDSMGYCKLITGCVGGVCLAVASRMGAIGPALTAIGAIGCLWFIVSSRSTSRERSVEIVAPRTEYAVGFHYVVKRDGRIIGDIIGTCHEDAINHKRLNPTIEEAVIKAKKVAFESGLVHPEETLKKKALEMQEGFIEDYQAFHRKHFDKNKVISNPELKKVSLKYYVVKDTGTEYLIIKKATASHLIPLETDEELGRASIYLENEFLIMEEHVRKGRILEGLDSVDIDFPLRIAYQTGDEALLKKQLKWRKNLSPAYAKFVIENRNISMAARAAPLLQNATKEERVVIAVGCGHLFGKKGMISLLKESLGSEYSIEKATAIPAGASRERVLNSSGIPESGRIVVGADAFDDADSNFTKESSANFSDSVICDPEGIAEKA